MTYEEFLQSKQFKYNANGKIIDKSTINPVLFEFQKDIVKWAVKLRRRAIGCELKESYFKIAIQNLRSISASQDDLFSMLRESA